MENLKKIFQNKRFNKSESLNKIIFVSKIGIIDNNLIVILKDEAMEKPIATMVETIIKMNKDYYVFFDGKYESELEKKEFLEYKNLITEKEWRDLFNERGILNILNEYNFEEKGYYLDIHENLSTVTEEYEVIDLEVVKGLF